MRQDKGLVYIYCITKNALTGNVRGINGQRIYGISGLGLSAIVSRVPRKEFGKKQLVKNLKDPSWTEKMLRKHADATGKVMRKQTLLPLKFGTIFKSEQTAKAMLAANRQQFLTLLDRLRGKQEWGVKIYADLDKLENFIQKTNREIKRLKKKAQEATPGRSYLLQKKLEENLKKEIEQEALSLAQKIFDTLTKQSQESRLNELIARNLMGKDEEMILNSAHLVERKNFEQFKKSLNVTLKESKGLGLSGELSGPWPPYSFVS